VPPSLALLGCLSGSERWCCSIDAALPISGHCEFGLLGVSEGCCQCAGGTPRSLYSTAAGCSETQQCQIYIRAQILDVLHLKMFLLHRGQMSALHPLMMFPLHGDEMVVLSEAVDIALNVPSP
jgi:hypothetical protein